MSFAYAAGAWAFLGLIGVLAIHLLQRRRRRLVVSTLFLLEALQPRSERGRSLERLRSSVALWLQLAAVALVALLLMGPERWRVGSFQRVALVLDASASMDAFRARLEPALRERVPAWGRSAADTEWLLLESQVAAAPLYSGHDSEELLRGLRAWRAMHPGHAPAPALEAARIAVGASGQVVFVSDHVPEGLPAGVELLAIGTPTDNVGFAGVDVRSSAGTFVWRAYVRNYARAPVRRAWQARAGNVALPGGTLELQADELRELTGPWPTGHEELELTLTPDDFPLDDRLPIVLPQPKRLRVRVEDGAEQVPFVGRLLGTLEAIEHTAAESADLVVRASAPGEARLAAPTLTFAPGTRPQPAGAIVAAQDALVDGLDWRGLLVPARATSEPRAGDSVLLWCEDRPLVWLRPGPRRELVVGFPLAGSSAERSPAFLLLLHRFAEDARARRVDFERRNLEVGERIVLGGDEPLQGVELVAGGRLQALPHGALVAPLLPGFFELRQAGDKRLVAAAHFADAREADLRGASGAGAQAPLPSATSNAARREEHPWVPWALLALALLMVLDWRLAEWGA